MLFEQASMRLCIEGAAAAADSGGVVTKKANCFIG